MPVGEPKAPVSTVSEEKKSIEPMRTTLVALDHDTCRASVTPSVALQCELPPDAKMSFVQGQVTVVVNDSVFKLLIPFPHASMLAKIAQGKKTIADPPVHRWGN